MDSYSEFLPLMARFDSWVGLHALAVGCRLGPPKTDGTARLRPRAPWRVNRTGDTGTALNPVGPKGWVSTTLLSAMDDEPGRRYRLRLESGRPRKGWVSNTPSSAKDTKPGRRTGSRWKRVGVRKGLGIMSSGIRHHHSGYGRQCLPPTRSAIMYIGLGTLVLIIILLILIF